MTVSSSTAYRSALILTALCFAGEVSTVFAKGNPSLNECRAELQECQAELQQCDACGDGILGPGEQCDIGQFGGETCDTSTGGNLPLGTLRCWPGCVFDTTDCTESVCGDGIPSGDEQCDDGNTAGGDGCSATCQAEVCGNGVLEGAEDCDDGNVVAGDGCSGGCRVEIACNWPGEARWLSHGFDGGAAFATGAWLSCTAGLLSDVRFVNDGGTAVTPVPSGTSDARVGCNWLGARWASQGFDGATAFVAGSTVSCDGVLVTGLAWEADQLGATAATAGDLACNWTGAIYLSHGFDGGCAFQTGFDVTCNADRITHFEWVEGCARAR